MAVSFVRLGIAGFKSFADPATVEILPGLTGVVGPNGCGKSNVAEALRWAMGEGNARTLRGAEMDDVIFAGSAARPGRNLAEVTLTLEEDGSPFPPPFAGAPELSVVRRIERGGGSAYRVNGREARARDVQTLFADLASGARSSAMVSQGRVGTLVAARPEERRSVLEEAAGISGLHARRAEADAKLRAAEANLERADERRALLEGQLAGLRSQAKQAARYRTLSTAVEEAEAALLSLQQARAAAAQDAAARGLLAAQDGATRAVAAAVGAEAAAAAAAAALPRLRQAEAACRTTLERAKLAEDGVQAEAARARGALEAATARRAQLARDLAYAEQVRNEAAAVDARLVAEAERLAAEAAAHPPLLAAARAEAAEAAAAMQQADAAAHAATDRAAALAAGAQALSQLLAQAEQRMQRADAVLARLRADRARAAAQDVDPARLAAVRHAAAAAAEALAAARLGLEQADAARTATHARAVAAREAQGRADAARLKLAAEVGALQEVLAVGDQERWPPMVDRLEVPPGLEAALGAVLGEGLAAAADPGAARHWRALPPLPQRPVPGQALAETVRAPAIMNRALGAVGLVESAADGEAAQAGLAPGQSLVTRDGAVWRWDGYTVRAGTPTAAAVRLQQRNRLNGLVLRLREAEAECAGVRAARQAADAAEQAAATAEQRARTARREAESRAERSGTDASTLQASASQVAARLLQLDEQAAQAGPEQAEAEAALADARRQRAAAPDVSLLRAEAERSRAALAAARTRESGAQRALDAVARAGAARDGRLGTIGREREDRRMRAADAAARVVDLCARVGEAERQHAELSAAPDAVARRAAQCGEERRAADAAQAGAAQALAAAERDAAATAAQARAAEQAAFAAREAAVRADSARVQAVQAFEAAAARIAERAGALPALPPAPADLSAAAEERLRGRWQRLGRERDEMGPVNLRAEIEARAIEVEAETIDGERAELGTAIAKLRGGIGHLNREGRERLSAVFQQVDRQFQALFSRMFGGGKAHLGLVGSDDPLQAGLEIYAQPPGKKLATLSLLSGGEQALTALSLIFAVFRCNPAPLCVLDEVDAPLDDANVERFCALLADMVRDTGTRFLVVTHHQMTMARMDRLYGVTMQERGVSRLLSVDLSQAVGMVERAAAE